MIDFFYTIAWKCAIPFLRKNKRIALGFEERMAKQLPPQCDIWFHGASAGEVKLIVQCIQKLQYTRASRILITTWTKEGRSLITQCSDWAKEHAPHITIYACYFPFDTADILERFITAVSPSLILIAETELWYMLFTLARNKGIPLCIINGRISHKTQRFTRILRWLFRRSNPEQILAISSQDKERFSSIFPKSMYAVMNNIKFQSVTLAPLTTQSQIPSLTFASLRKKEFNFIAQCLHHIYNKESLPLLQSAIYYIIPRHLHHIQYLQQAITQARLRYTLCTTIEEAHEAHTNIRIINIFGKMEYFYSQSDAIFVGGSLFPDYGGHNFLEALTHGVIPIVGPYRTTFIWAEEGLKERKLLMPLDELSIPEMISTLNSMLQYKACKADVQQRFISWIQDKQDGIGSVQALLTQYNL